MLHLKNVGCLIKSLELFYMKNLGIIMALTLVLGVVGCESPHLLDKDGVSLKCVFGLTNNGNEEVHMWITGESIGQYNQVAVGARREVDYALKNRLAGGENLTEWEEVTVYAGRNGNVLTSFTTSINSASIFARFAWDGFVITQY